MPNGVQHPHSLAVSLLVVELVATLEELGLLSEADTGAAFTRAEARLRDVDPVAREQVLQALDSLERLSSGRSESKTDTAPASPNVVRLIRSE